MVERRKQFSLEPDQTEPAAPHLREVGGAEHVPNVSLTLRMARQRAGHDLKDVARVLRIRASNLEAIESGRFDDLPGPTYVTGFLRSYADYLGLDRDEIITRYREEIGASSRQKLSFPTASHEGRMPRGWLVFFALVLVALAYGGWYYYSSQNKGPAVIVSEPPADATAATGPSATAEPEAAESTPAATTTTELVEGSAASAPSAIEDAGTPSTPATVTATPNAEAPPATVDAASSASSEGAAPAATETVAVGTTTTNSADAIVSATTAPTTAAPSGEDEITETSPPEPVNAAQAEAEQAAPITAAAASATALSQTNTAATATAQGGSTAAAITTSPAPVAASGPSRVTIGARVDSWLQIQGPGNELIVTRILRPGETFAVPDRPGLQMVTGNAGGLEITVDGQPIAPVGPMGVVRRNILLDADSLRSTYGVVSR